MLNLTKIQKFIAAVFLQVAVIAVIVIYKSAILAGGTDILLELQPVDPRDFLRGDYVTVSYKISNMDYYSYGGGRYYQPDCPNCAVPFGAPSNELVAPSPNIVMPPPNNSDIRNGDTVYVPLYKYGKFWQASGGVTKTKPAENFDQQRCSSDTRCLSALDSYGGQNSTMYIQGKVVSGAEETQNQYYPSYGYTKHLTIVYGIENYFIPEGKGRTLNGGGLAGSNYARVSLNADGKAVLKQLYINDKPWP